MKMKVAGICFFIALSCHAPKNVSSSMQSVFDLEGHRGCRGLMPENTVPAMLRALQLGVTTLEMDAVITHDRQVVMSHEPFFNHEIATKPDGSTFTVTEDGKYNIYKMDYAEVKTWDVGLKPHPRYPGQQKQHVAKPRLSDLVDSVEEYIRVHHLKQVDYNIETKCLPATDNLFHPEPAIFVQLLMDVIVEKKIQSRTIIQSFDIRTLKLMHEKYPGVRTSLLIEDYDKRPAATQLQLLGFTPAVYSPAYQLVDAALVGYCHAQKMKLIPWTVNDQAEYNRLRQLGVDGIITDFPDRIGPGH